MARELNEIYPGLMEFSLRRV